MAAIGNVSLRAAEAELFNMATGVTPRFDLKNVLTQVSGALLAKGMGSVFNKVRDAIPAAEGSATQHTIDLAHRAAQTLADNTLGMALNHTPINAEAMAAQALGNHVGQHIGHKYVTPRFGGNDDKAATRPKAERHTHSTRSSTRDIHAKMAQHKPQTRTPLNDPHLAEAEMVAHGSLVPDAKLDLSHEAIAEARQAQLPKGYAKIHDKKDAMLGIGADIFKGTPVGALYSSVKDTRVDLRTLAYGDHDAKMTSLRHLSVDAALIVAGGVGGMAIEAIPVIASAVSRLSIFGKGMKGVENTGAFSSSITKMTGNGLGKLEGKQVQISQKGYDLVSKHLTQFGPVKENELMLQRLQYALDNRLPLTGADASFYIHEATEATKMNKGMEYSSAHLQALNKYQVSPFSVYHPDVISQVNLIEPGSFNINWINFWNKYQDIYTNKP
ncbi:MAG: hypothetical protein ACYC0J_10275 [Gammaproteobacteria bacterium]